MGRNYAKFSKLGRLYILALSAIAVSIIISGIFIQDHLQKQTSDSRVINVAGRQRMLSQKISKLVLQIKPGQPASTRDSIYHALHKTLKLWQKSHEGLRYGNENFDLPGNNSEKTDSMFARLEPHYQQMASSTQKILSMLESNPGRPFSDFKPYRKTILDHENAFLTGMNRIVFQYDREAKAKVNQLKIIEVSLLSFSILIIVLEIFFIFRPTSRRIKKTIQELIDYEQQAYNLAEEKGRLYNSLAESYKDLSDITNAVDQAIMFARADENGKIFYFNEKFGEVKNEKPKDYPLHLSDFFQEEDPTFEEVLNQLNNNKVWDGEVSTLNTEQAPLWLRCTMVPISKDNQKQFLIFARDITERKRAQEQVVSVQKEAYERIIEEQKLRSVLIIQGQEEERKRIARDIHDGIGQLLTALKFQIEGISYQNPELLAQHLKDLRQLTKNIIREVRIVSFNLTPSVLSDYGLISALNNLSTEISKLTGIKIIFNDFINYDKRLDINVETNLFRISQEAVNNAVKYAEPTEIYINTRQESNNLSIEVIDNGKGFDAKNTLTEDFMANTIHGIANMKERTNFINGYFEIDSKPGKGTFIKITYPLENEKIFQKAREKNNES